VRARILSSQFSILNSHPPLGKRVGVRGAIEN
jgi:hypothetical protein